MNTQHYLIVACALVSASAVHAWEIEVFNGTAYTAEVRAGRTAGSTVTGVVLPQATVKLNMGQLLNDSVYAYVSMPDATGKVFTTKETKEHYSSSGQRAYSKFVLYGPVNGEFYLGRITF